MFQFLQTLTSEEHALPDKEIAAERDAQNAQQFCQTLTRVAPGGGTEPISDVMLGLRSEKWTLVMAWRGMISGP